MKKKKTLLIACLAVSISIPALSSTFGLYEPSWFSRKKKKETPAPSDYHKLTGRDTLALQGVMNVIKNGCADFFNIKVGKVGGLYRACQVAAAVEAAGFQAAAGSNLELGIGEAASAHFITSQPAVCLPSDAFCGTGLHAENLIKTPLAMTPQGTFSCNNAPGLGIEVDESIFEK